MNELLNAALRYAFSGQPVFPCRSDYPKAKSPLTKHGHKDATTDEMRICDWWERWPGASIGIPTGLVWDVLDVDNKPGGANGFATVKSLKDRGFLGGLTRYVATPNAGAHLYFPASGDMRNATFADYGVDLRGLGGYVIAPPSTLYDKDGKVIGSYVVKGSSERGSPLIWREIRSLLKPAKHVVPGLSHYSAGSLEAWVRALKEGQRNDGLWWAARTAIEEGRDPWTLADAAQKTGLDIGEITKVIESAQNADGVA